MPNRRKRNGFSLAEMVIVLAILAILAAITLSRMSLHRVLSMNRACNGIMSLLKRAADAYYADSGGQIPSVSDLIETEYLSGHPKDPHDTHIPYTFLRWEGDQVKVICPASPDAAHPVTFPPGHLER